MIVAELFVRSSSSEEKGSAVVTIEKKVGEIWEKVKVWPVVLGSKEANKKILLEEGQRIIVEGSAARPLIYDRNQMALVVAPGESSNAK